MYNFIVVADDHDSIIGENCKLSYDYLLSQVAVDTFNLHLLMGADCLAVKVQDAIDSFKKENFILVAYSHGRSNALVSTYEDDGYVTVAMAPHFETSLVYTNSCLTGRELMQALIHNKCQGYVGYKDIVKVPARVEDELIFIACENQGLIHFLTTGDSLTESVEKMKQLYDAQAKSYAKKKQYLNAGRLRRNLNNLVYHDCNFIKRENFIVENKAEIPSGE